MLWITSCSMKASLIQRKADFLQPRAAASCSSSPDDATMPGLKFWSLLSCRFGKAKLMLSAPDGSGLFYCCTLHVV